MISRCDPALPCASLPTKPHRQYASAVLSASSMTSSPEFLFSVGHVDRICHGARTCLASQQGMAGQDMAAWPITYGQLVDLMSTIANCHRFLLGGPSRPRIRPSYPPSLLAKLPPSCPSPASLPSPSPLALAICSECNTSRVTARDRDPFLFPPALPYVAAKRLIDLSKDHP